MREKKENMLSVPLQSLDPTAGFGGPLFVYLPLNDKFVPVRLSGDPLGANFFRRLQQRNFTELWTWAVHKNASTDLATGKEKDQAASKRGKPENEVLAEKRGSAGPTEPLNRAFLSAAHPGAAFPLADEGLVAEVFKEEALSPEEKVKILSDVGRQFLRTVSQLRSKDQADKEASVKGAKRIVDQILLVASEQSDIYTEILNIRQSQEDIEHSTMVGTMAAMFALSLGYTDEKLLSDIVAAAVFHDVGLVEINKDFLFKKRSEWSDEERKEYRTHTALSVRLLEESQLSFHPRVVRMVAEHHEQYDGEGFPLGLRGARIDETSQLLALANYFDHLCNGRDDGVEVPFAEAFELVFTRRGGGPMIASPELVQRVYQFSTQERAAAEAIRAEAAQKVERTGRELGLEGKVS